VTCTHFIEKNLHFCVAFFTIHTIRGLGKNPWGVFCLYLYVISLDFDSGVDIPVTLTFWPGGGVNTLANPPPSAHA